jgi:hypothetical protein
MAEDAMGEGGRVPPVSSVARFCLFWFWQSPRLPHLQSPLPSRSGIINCGLHFLDWTGRPAGLQISHGRIETITHQGKVCSLVAVNTAGAESRREGRRRVEFLEEPNPGRSLGHLPDVCQAPPFSFFPRANLALAYWHHFGTHWHPA